VAALPGASVGRGCTLARRDRLALGVAADPVHGLGPPREDLEDLAHQRAGDHVSGRDDRVDPLGVELGEDGTQRGQVPVDVGEDGGPHTRNLKGARADANR
jgi:hypothetical protein